ncbi:uncharacterized protein LOC143435099 isoform X3 [Arvicanthis niloticus]|uniref:uncharacterized protein LOC143309482 isoform X3 n=1 Tax=Arvicanthis niloticus TaxID=61156 RepID=UPI00402B52A8
MEAFTKPVCTGSTELCPTRSSGASGEEGYPYCAVIKFKTQRGIFCYHPALSLPLLRIGSPTSRSTRNSRPMRRCRDLNWISPAIRGHIMKTTWVIHQTGGLPDPCVLKLKPGPLSYEIMDERQLCPSPALASVPITSVCLLEMDTAVRKEEQAACRPGPLFQPSIALSQETKRQQ